jgi:hypothetical protein
MTFPFEQRCDVLSARKPVSVHYGRYVLRDFSSPPEDALDAPVVVTTFETWLLVAPGGGRRVPRSSTVRQVLDLVRELLPDMSRYMGIQWCGEVGNVIVEPCDDVAHFDAITKPVDWNTSEEPTARSTGLTDAQLDAQVWLTTDDFWTLLVVNEDAARAACRALPWNATLRDVFQAIHEMCKTCTSFKFLGVEACAERGVFIARSRPASECFGYADLCTSQDGCAVITTSRDETQMTAVLHHEHPGRSFWALLHRNAATSPVTGHAIPECRCLPVDGCTGLDVVRAIREMTHASGSYVSDRVFLEGVHVVAPGVVVAATSTSAEQPEWPC